MADEPSPQPEPSLQFDRVERDQPAGDAPASPGVTCRSCGELIRTHYFSLGAASVCERCARSLERSRQEATSWGHFGRAILFGGIAAIIGAVLYYAIAAIFSLEIGLVAIAIGYMVGYAVRRGSQGWGGLRYQVLAVFLTYYSVGLSYLPFAIQGARRATPSTGASSPAAVAPAPDSPPADSAPVERPPLGTLFLGTSLLLLLALALPILSVFASFPSGLIGALIIGIGMRQAWGMTAAPPFEVMGPYRVGTSTTPA